MSTALSSALSADRPFPGLRPFAFADSAFFFGREDQSYELYRRLDRSRFIAVVGSSGSGKSSLVRAGLHPLIAEESAEDAGRRWHWLEMRPGDAPLKSLAAALAALAPAGEDPALAAGRRERFFYILRRSRFGIGEIIDGLGGLGDTSLLLFVDQFEELFRFAAGAGRAGAAAWQDEAVQFVQLLLQAAREPGRAFHVLLTMRSDFIGECARFHDLPEAVSASQYLVPALTRDQRETVIRGPIDKAGATIDASLVERLLNDAGDELDQLPVLQHCLMRLWEEAQRRCPGERPHPTPQDYRAIGGIAHALSQHADEIMAGLPGDELAVEQVFRALCERDAEGRATRRALPFARLVAETGIREDTVRRVLDRFRADDCSFLLPLLSQQPVLAPETPIDVGHEALLRRWDRISAEPAVEVGGAVRPGGWLRQEANDGQTYRALLALLEGGRTLPLDQVEMRWHWWNERPRTEAWAERYGGRIERVRQLFDDSRAALAAEEARRAAERRRQRRSFVLVTAGFVVSLIFACVALSQWIAADRARARAQRSLALATDTVNGLIFDLAAKFRNLGLPAATVEDILDRARGLQQQLISGGETAPELRFSRVEALIETAHSLLAIGDTKGALAAARQARQLLQALLAAAPDRSDYRRELAVSDDWIGDALRRQGDLAGALAAYRDALAITKALARKGPDNAEWQDDLSVSDDRVGDVLQARNDFAGALAAYQDGRAIRRALARTNPGNAERQRELAVSDNKIGDVLQARNDLAGALAAYRDGRAIRRALVRKNPGNTEWQRDLSVCDERIGDVLLRQGDLAGALAAYRDSLAIIKALARKDPSNAEWQRELAVSDERIGDVLQAQSDPAGALAAYRDSLETSKALAQKDPSNTLWQRDLELAYEKIGNVLKAQGHLDQALACYRDGLAVARALAKKDPGDRQRQQYLAYVLGKIADTELSAGDAAAALAADEERLTIWRQLYYAAARSGPAQSGLVNALGNVAFDLLLNHRPQDALDRAEEALKRDPEALWIETDRAHALLFLNRFGDAKAVYLKYKDARLADGRRLATAVKDDFALFRKFGINTADMQRIEALL